MKQLIVILLICSILCVASGCTGKTASPVEESVSQEKAMAVSNSLAESREAKEIIRDIILYYGYYQEKAGGKIDSLFNELDEADPGKSILWREIFDYWKYTKSGLEINYGKLPEDLPKGDNLCLISLGYKLNEDGSIRPELEERLKVLLECANQYPNAYIVCTGGGTASGNKEVTEAGQMADWLIKNGVSKDRIIVEDKSLTTAQNAINTYKILREQYPQVDTAAIISSDYHIGWGSILFQAECMLNREKDGSQPISVVSNAAMTPEEAEDYPFNFQAAGLLELIGDDSAWDIYYYKFNEDSLTDVW